MVGQTPPRTCISIVDLRICRYVRHVGRGWRDGWMVVVLVMLMMAIVVFTLMSARVVYEGDDGLTCSYF